jgi:uncharacterized protein (UPF0303 family)
LQEQGLSKWCKANPKANATSDSFLLVVKSLLPLSRVSFKLQKNEVEPKRVSLEADIAQLKIQEQQLQFSSFTEEDAWNLGNAMRAAALKKKHPFVIDIRSAGRKLFYAALPGSVPENENWVQRKINIVMAKNKSSYHIGRELAQNGRTLDQAMGFNPIDVAPHGGCFPIIIKNVGVVGTITVSGIPQREDHNFVVEHISAYLKLDHDKIKLATE